MRKEKVGSTMGLKLSPLGETFRFFIWQPFTDGLIENISPQSPQRSQRTLWFLFCPVDASENAPIPSDRCIAFGVGFACPEIMTPVPFDFCCHYFTGLADEDELLAHLAKLKPQEP